LVGPGVSFVVGPGVGLGVALGVGYGVGLGVGLSKTSSVKKGDGFMFTGFKVSEPGKGGSIG